MGELGFTIFNGEIIDRKQAVIDVEDRGYQFGDGVYEVIRVYNGKMFTAEEHLNRFGRSSENIGITLPFTKVEMKEQLESLIEKNNLQLGIIYMQITRGTAPRNHAFPSGEIKPTIVAYTKELKRPTVNLQTGVKTVLVEDVRWLRCDIKSLNLLGNVLAKQYAAEAGCFEAIQHRGEAVTEGSSSNIFIVKNGVIHTHPSNNLILKGITRDVILQLCSKNEIFLEERAFSLEDLNQADEIFLSSTTAEVMPIVELNGGLVKNGEPGSITRKLQALFEEEIKKQCGIL